MSDKTRRKIKAAIEEYREIMRKLAKIPHKHEYYHRGKRVSKKEYFQKGIGKLVREAWKINMYEHCYMPIHSKEEIILRRRSKELLRYIVQMASRYDISELLHEQVIDKTED